MICKLYAARQVILMHYLDIIGVLWCQDRLSQLQEEYLHGKTAPTKVIFDANMAILS